MNTTNARDETTVNKLIQPPSIPEELPMDAEQQDELIGGMKTGLNNK